MTNVALVWKEAHQGTSYTEVKQLILWHIITFQSSSEKGKIIKSSREKKIGHKQWTGVRYGIRFSTKIPFLFQ